MGVLGEGSSYSAPPPLPQAAVASLQIQAFCRDTGFSAGVPYITMQFDMACQREQLRLPTMALPFVKGQAAYSFLRMLMGPVPGKELAHLSHPIEGRCGAPPFLCSCLPSARPRRSSWGRKGGLTGTAQVPEAFALFSPGTTQCPDVMLLFPDLPLIFITKVPVPFSSLHNH